MITFERISKGFKGDIGAPRVQALRDVSFSVPSGEVFGFLGPNGAGKSTTIKILINLIRPDEGYAKILDLNVANSKVRKKVGFLPENPYFYDYLTARELLWFGGKAAGLDKQTIAQNSVELLGQVGLERAVNRQLRTYSKGMVQRAGLALALIHDPEVVILDEPMSGLDPIGRKMVGDLIIDLKNRGKTVFFSSHILNDVERFCDRVAIISDGCLRKIGPLKDLLSRGESLEDVFLREVKFASETVQ